MSVRFVSYPFRLPIGLNRSNGRFAAFNQSADNREGEEDYLSSHPPQQFLQLCFILKLFLNRF